MAKKSLTKGHRVEKELEKIIQSMGYNAQRVPLSGSVGGDFRGDILSDPLLFYIGDGKEKIHIEVKIRANGFQQLYKWLEKADILCVRADRKDWLAIIPLDKLKRKDI